ncbi:MAG: class I SAM-dependent methyltransferase [Lachnospiraceae bacterium]|nr:class I SAM-dependent methyltransferase [Lachnospiraceae bacterium]
MKEYTGFASVYDMFMDNVPYDEWAKYLHGLLTENGVSEGIVLELGCGTGKMTRRLRDMGYDMIGVDFSSEMLQIAQEKEDGTAVREKENDAATQDKEDGTAAQEKEDGAATQEKEDGTAVRENENGAVAPGKKDLAGTQAEKGEILYLCQDMREFELYGSVAAVVSVCDSINYITEDGDLETVFALVHNYLDPGGVFIFDMNTEYYYKYVLGEQTICETRDEGSFIWENYYDEENMINEFDMTVYVSTGRDKLYERFDEVHYQRAYKLSEVKKLLKAAGMKNIRVYAAMEHEAPVRSSERVYFVAKK